MYMWKNAYGTGMLTDSINCMNNESQKDAVLEHFSHVHMHECTHIYTPTLRFLDAWTSDTVLEQSNHG
jgi:hypothetical protein